MRHAFSTDWITICADSVYRAPFTDDDGAPIIVSGIIHDPIKGLFNETAMILAEQSFGVNATADFSSVDCL
jgi:hypothetical protein